MCGFLLALWQEVNEKDYIRGEYKADLSTRFNVYIFNHTITSNIPTHFSLAHTHQGRNDHVIYYQSAPLSSVPWIMLGKLWKGMPYGIPSTAMSPQFKTGTEGQRVAALFVVSPLPPVPSSHKLQPNSLSAAAFLYLQPVPQKEERKITFLHWCLRTRSLCLSSWPSPKGTKPLLRSSSQMQILVGKNSIFVEKNGQSVTQKLCYLNIQQSTRTR